MERGLKAKTYRPGGFVLHPAFLAVALVGVAVWLALFFARDSTHGGGRDVVAALLVVLGLSLACSVFLVTVVEAIGTTIWSFRGDERRLRYVYLAWCAPAVLAALALGFAFGYLAGVVL